MKKLSRAEALNGEVEAETTATSVAAKTLCIPHDQVMYSKRSAYITRGTRSTYAEAALTLLPRQKHPARDCVRLAAHMCAWCLTMRRGPADDRPGASVAAVYPRGWCARSGIVVVVDVHTIHVHFSPLLLARVAKKKRISRPGLNWFWWLLTAVQHSVAQHSMAQHSMAQHSTAQHNRPWFCRGLVLRRYLPPNLLPVAPPRSALLLLPSKTHPG